MSAGRAGGATANPFDTMDTQQGRIINMPAGKTNTAADPDPELQSMKEHLEETISLELGATDISDKVQMTYDSRGLWSGLRRRIFTIREASKCAWTCSRFWIASER